MLAQVLSLRLWSIVIVGQFVAAASAQDVPMLVVEGQPLGANVKRLVQALEYLGAPLPQAVTEKLLVAADSRDTASLQETLDSHVLFVVSINPELRVKVQRGPAKARLQQGGFKPCVVKVLNQGTVSNRLRIVSPQSGPVYSGASLSILERQAQTELNEDENIRGDRDRFLQVEMFQSPPMTRNLSGLEVEYAIALIYSSERGKREATIGFDIGAGNQDIGFRGEAPVLFDVAPAIPVRLSILDDDGTPTAARLVIRDEQGHVYPPQAKRLAPDFFFQPQIYRRDGEVVMLPPGKFTVECSRGPEYHVDTKRLVVSGDEAGKLDLRLRRWIDPEEYGFYCGDHHIHAAGCSHYDNPTQGVQPEDMFVQVQGEGLNVGCVLTWGPCYDYQRQFFAPKAASISEPRTLLKYDLEISGFGSQALGHVCLLNLSDQTYPGSEETKEKGWPTWTVPVLRWTKEQGGHTGYPHSAFDYDPPIAARHLIEKLDADDDGVLNTEEANHELLPEEFGVVDEDGNARLTVEELTASTDRATNRLPNVALPDMGGSGALEICVSTSEGVCDFISAMNTPRTSEWNIWYHLLNCGFPLKLSGETDFPCMSSRRVGQGRVYVQLGQVDRLEFAPWCKGLAEGRSYVSDGFAHAVEFSVNDITPGTEDVQFSAPGNVRVWAEVVFAQEMPEGVAYGNQQPVTGSRLVGDTRNLHAPRSDRRIEGGTRLVEIIMNGRVVGSTEVPADGKPHAIDLEVPVNKSSWIALRQFPQLHTNPVNVIVGRQQIRASRASALWCAEVVRLLWLQRHDRIAEDERPAARAAYDRAIETYEAMAAE